MSTPSILTLQGPKSIKLIEKMTPCKINENDIIRLDKYNGDVMISENVCTNLDCIDILIYGDYYTKLISAILLHLYISG